MKQIRLISLQIGNFKGIKSMSFEFTGKSYAIKGPNATKKTSVADAFSWLLFGKDMEGRSDFGIKMVDKNKKEIHDLMISVAARVSVDGVERILIRVQEENWVKKQGSSSAKVLEGNLTYGFVDGLKVKKSAFDKAIAEIIDEKIFRAISNVYYFNDHVDKATRRQMLVDFANDVKVVPSEDIVRLLGVHHVDDALKIRKDEISGLLKESDEISAVVRAAESDLASSPEVQKPSMNQVGAEAKKADLESSKARIIMGDKTALINSLNTKRKERSDKASDADRATLDFYSRKSSVNSAISDVDAAISAARSAMAIADRNVSDLNKSLELLRSEWYAIDKSDISSCGFCHRSYDDQTKDLADDLKDKAAEAKKELESRADTAKKSIAAHLKTVKDIREKESALTERRRLLLDEVDNMTPPDPPDFSEIDAEIKSLEEQIERPGEYDKVAVEKIDAELVSIAAAILEIEAYESNHRLRKDAQDRIDARSKRKSEIGARLDLLDLEVAKLGKYRTDTMRLIESSVSAAFAPLQISLFEDQVNGNVAEVCDVMVPDESGAMVAWSKGASTGQKIIAGLRVISALCERYQVSAPVFIDNAESLTIAVPEDIKQTLQMIMLSAVVTESGKIETSEV
jgi:hypothetical protein